MVTFRYDLHSIIKIFGTDRKEHKFYRTSKGQSSETTSMTRSDLEELGDCRSGRPHSTDLYMAPGGHKSGQQVFLGRRAIGYVGRAQLPTRSASWSFATDSRCAQLQPGKQP
jgi:hypothetical protein